MHKIIKQFETFLESLEKDDKELVNTIRNGFKICFEAEDFRLEEAALDIKKVKTITFYDLGYGIVLKRGVEEIFMQGDDASQVREEIENLEKDWKSRNFQPIGPFKTYEDHLEVILDQYFVGREPQITKPEKMITIPEPTQE